MCWLAVDKNGTENIFQFIPIRKQENGYWKWDDIISDVVEMPKGSIKKLIGRDLTWNDDAVELS